MNKYRWQIITIVLAAIIMVFSISSLFERPAKQVEQIPTEQVVINSIMTRNSVRKYTDQIITPTQVETILKAGMAAPTAGNRQPWEFYVVRNTNIIKQMTKVTKFAAPMNKNAKLAIVVCGVPSESFPVEPRYWVQDVSAATENILLATHAMGLGAVWAGVYPGEDRVETLRELLNVPERLVPFNIIMMGYPDGEQTIKDKWKPEKIHYVGK